MGLFDSFFGKKDNLDTWIRNASDKELDDAYERDRTTTYMRTGKHTPLMNKVNNEHSRRYAERNKDKLNRKTERWTDAARWEKD